MECCACKEVVECCACEEVVECSARKEVDCSACEEVVDCCVCEEVVECCACEEVVECCACKEVVEEVTKDSHKAVTLLRGSKAPAESGPRFTLFFTFCIRETPQPMQNILRSTSVNCNQLLNFAQRKDRKTLCAERLTLTFDLKRCLCARSCC